MIPKTTITIATKNSGALLKDCLAKVSKTTFAPYEIIIVNAGDAVDVSYFKGEIRVINSPNLLLPHSMNLGAKEAKNEFVTNFADDSYPTDHWLTHAHEDFKKNFPDGFGILILNDGKWKGYRDCFHLTNKKSIDKLLGGYIYDERFYHFRVDVDYYERAMASGKAVFTERVRMVHKHVGGASSGRQYWKEDWATYARIKKERNANRM